MTHSPGQIIGLWKKSSALLEFFHVIHVRFHTMLLGGARSIAAAIYEIRRASDSRFVVFNAISAFEILNGTLVMVL